MKVIMKKLFVGFYGVDDSDTESLWKSDKTVFVFDTNALLLLYRCEKETRDAFFSQWEKIKDRVWLPYHVCLEYQRNRLTAIKDHVLELENAGNHLTKKALEAIALSSLEPKHASTIRRYESLKKKLDELNNNFRSTVDKFVKEQINTRISEADFLKNHDTVRDRISDLSSERIGVQPDQVIIDKLEKEGEIRYKKKIPPGYEDEKTKKDEVFSFNGITYKRKFGDWFVWKEILNYVEIKETSSVVYVTNDEKEDWWYEIGGRTRGPHESLKTELAEKGQGTVLLLYNSSSFLNSANRFLKGARTSEKAILELERVSADTKKSNELLLEYAGVRHLNMNKSSRKNRLKNILIDRLNKDKKDDDIKWVDTSEYYGVVGNADRSLHAANEISTDSLFSNIDDAELKNLMNTLRDELKVIEAEIEGGGLSNTRVANLVDLYKETESHYRSIYNELKRRIFDL